MSSVPVVIPQKEEEQDILGLMYSSSPLAILQLYGCLPQLHKIKQDLHPLPSEEYHLLLHGRILHLPLRYAFLYFSMQQAWVSLLTSPSLSNACTTPLELLLFLPMRCISLLSCSIPSYLQGKEALIAHNYKQAYSNFSYIFHSNLPQPIYYVFHSFS